MFSCNKCNKAFARKDYLNNHLKRKNRCDLMTGKMVIDGKIRFPCKYCDYSFCRKNYLINHLNNIHKLQLHAEEIKELKDKIKLMEASQNNAQSVSIINNINNGINITNNVNNVNNVNIILINPIGKENCSFLDTDNGQKLLENCAKNPYKGFPKLTKVLNFNLNYPENHNISYDNKTKICQLANGLSQQKLDEGEAVRVIIDSNDTRICEYAEANFNEEEQMKLKIDLKIINELEKYSDNKKIKAMLNDFHDVFNMTPIIEQNKKNKGYYYDYNNPDKYTMEIQLLESHLDSESDSYSE